MKQEINEINQAEELIKEVKSLSLELSVKEVVQLK